MTTLPTQTNRRELSYWLLFSTLVLFGIMLTVGAVRLWQSSGSTPMTMQLGTLDDFPPSSLPYLAGVGQPFAIPSVWVVNLDGVIRVYDTLTPSRTCRYAWNSATGQFVDPCSGSKFHLDGTLLESPARRDLDQYPVTVENGVITFNPYQLNEGTCRDFTKVDVLDNNWNEASPPPECETL